jgi:PIN domain nuclease of toxin-antitoxin system
VLLWWLFDDPKLSERARDLIREPDNRILISTASAWEIAIKYHLGKLPEASEAAQKLPELLRAEQMEVLAIGLEHALAAGALPPHHRDPFDRMLIAQSRLEGAPLVTSDATFARYEVEVVW